VAIGGGTGAGARKAALRLSAEGASALLSFGLAGGLDPALPAGAIVVPAAVVAGGARFPADTELCRWVGGPTLHLLLGAERIVVTPDEKKRLWEQTGCAAIDLESGAVAIAAAERRLPFAVLRVICDPAVRTLPPAALAGLDEWGRMAPSRVIRSLARQPGQLSSMLLLARDAAKARRSLLRHLEQVGTEQSFTSTR
jgi:adenosylhomocysteine nucleosidase